MTRRSTALPVACLVAGLLVATAWAPFGRLALLRAAAAVPLPEQFIGFKVGADNKLVRWDTIVDYMRQVASTSDRVRLRDLGRTNGGQPFIVLEISSPDTVRNLDRHKQLARKLYFQDGSPTPRERDEIFKRGKLVVLMTCSIHADEVGPTQMTLELVHQLATSDAPHIRKILDQVIFLLVPSLNPDGQIMVTDWFNRNLGTPYETSPLPTLYHPYAGHDNNRDMFMFTQKESEYTARLAWHDWFPVVWLDAHQMGRNGPRIFVMPATDPINPNVHPLIYRWNAILGQSQAAALEAAGKTGIIYNSTYTNFWQGAMAWSGWWHNQIGLLTEIASVRIAAPTIQLRAPSDRFTASPAESPTPARFDTAPMMPPTDTLARTEYPRPWLGGRWTLRDIVDYQLISTFALLETAADLRETITRQIYDVNRSTVEELRLGDVRSIVIPVEGQHDPREVAHLLDRLMLGGVEVYRADQPFAVDERRYGAGSFVVPMSQVFARYAKDLLEPQVYPAVRRGNDSTLEPPYDVTGWSLGMQLGVGVQFVRVPLPDALKLTRLRARPETAGQVSGTGSRFTFDYVGPDSAIAVNRLLKAGAHVSFEAPPPASAAGARNARVTVTGADRRTLDGLAREFGLAVSATPEGRPGPEEGAATRIRAPRIGLYAPWTGGNIDEGWTRWVLERYEFPLTPLHNQDVRDGRLRQRFDVIILPDQPVREMIDGYDSPTIRPEYRGGIGSAGVANLDRFVAEGGTLVTLGAACDLAIDQLAVPLRDLRRSLRRDQHSGPGSILRLQVDVTHPIGLGSAPETFGFYNNSPFFALEGLMADRSTVVARYPTRNVLASGWLRGEDLMAGRAAVVSVDMRPGRVVLFGIRPQHRAQTHATFLMLFNALYFSTVRTDAVQTF